MADAAGEPTDANSLAGAYRSQTVAAAWQRGAAGRAGALGPVTERMLDLAGVGVGSRVLDVAAGTGEQTLLAARRAGPQGYVLAVDISAEMLALAAESARTEGLSNVGTLVCNAQTLDLEPSSFDAAICRSGLMLMRDPVAALRGILHALRPGSKLSVLVFGAPERNPLQWLPTIIARRTVGVAPPAPGEPGMFALSASGALEAAFGAAGFQKVTVEVLTSTREFPAAVDAVRALQDSLPSVRALLARADEAARQQAWSEIERALTQFEGPGGVVAPSEHLLGVGTSPAASRT